MTVRQTGDRAVVALNSASALGHLIGAGLAAAASPFLGMVGMLLALNCAVCAWHSHRRPAVPTWVLGMGMATLMLLVHALLGQAGEGSGIAGHHGGRSAGIPETGGWMHDITTATTAAAALLQLVLIGHAVALRARGRAVATH